MPDGARVVIDASVVVALLQDPALGQRVLLGRRFTAPALVFPEVAHALRRLERLGQLDERASTALFETLLSLPMDIVDWRPGAARVWTLRHTVTPYDASYVALAELLDVPLVTADRRLANAPGIRCEVMLL